MEQVVIRALCQNIDLYSYTGHESDGTYFECFGPSDINRFHALLMDIPDDKRAIIYQKKCMTV